MSISRIGGPPRWPGGAGLGCSAMATLGAKYRRWNYSGVILASTIGGRKGDMPKPPDSGMFRASATT